MTIKAQWSFSIAAAAVVLLVACGKKEDAPTPSSGTSSTARASDVPKIDRRSASGRSYTFIDMSWDTLPQAEHDKVREQIRSLYWSGAAKNPERLAVDFSSAYRREADSFKKADLLKASADDLDKQFDAAQKTKDYSIRTEKAQVSVYPYDTQLGGFKVGFSSNMETEGIGIGKDADRAVNSESWLIRFVGVPASKDVIFKPKDEAQAREIESVLAAQRGASGREVSVDAVISGSVAGTIAKPNQLADIALFKADTVGIMDRKSGKTLFTFDSKDLGPIEPKCKSTREALKIPEAKVETSGAGEMYASPARDC